MSGCRKRRRGSLSSEAGLVVEEEENEDVVDTGVLDTISQQYESLDYDTNYNSVLVDEIHHKGYKFVFQQVHFQSLLLRRCLPLSLWRLWPLILQPWQPWLGAHSF